MIGIGGWVNLGSGPEIKILPPGGNGRGSGEFVGFEGGKADSVGDDDGWVGVVRQADEAVGTLGKIHGGCDQLPRAATDLLVDEECIAATVVRDGVRGIVGAVASLRIPDIDIVFARRSDVGT